MNLKKQRIKKILLVFFLLIVFFGVIPVLKANLFEINITKSLPVGVYLKIKKSIERDDLVVFCPPYNEFLRFAERNNFWINLEKSCGSTPKYMKKVVGMPQDDVSITFYGVFINQIKIKNSEPIKKILSDKIFQNYEKEFQLGDDEFFLMSDFNPNSFDSRYFGSIKKNKIISIIKPFWVWEKK